MINDKTNLQKYQNPKFNFKHLSEHPKGLDLEYTEWKNNYGKFAGAMSFSYIIFDNNKENGTIEVNYSCGGKCGFGYLVYIKKKFNGKWIIHKVEETYIS